MVIYQIGNIPLETIRTGDFLKKGNQFITSNKWVTLILTSIRNFHAFIGKKEKLKSYFLAQRLVDGWFCAAILAHFTWENKRNFFF